MSDLKEKFAQKVKEYGCKNEDLAVNYFIAIDKAIKKAEADRLTKDYRRNDPLHRWSTANLDDILQKSIAYANIGIDPLAPDMVSFTFYKNKVGGYDIAFIENVKCMEILARRYGVNCPENITVELVYSNDEFALKKKSLTNPIEGYEFNVTDPFDRGDIKGGVALTEYTNPIYNKVRPLSIAEIEKRVNTKTNYWANHKPKMCEKTVGKNAWRYVVLDTTELAEYYSATKNEEEEELPFEPENKEELPFEPEDEV